ncbi:MAG: hypothetical protein M1824_000670 [Vezdaea acicularis]|nr:MAG: hypothetical protein M1824_000670 [Vezdaea acicularis]
MEVPAGAALIDVVADTTTQKEMDESPPQPFWHKQHGRAMFASCSAPYEDYESISPLENESDENNTADEYVYVLVGVGGIPYKTRIMRSFLQRSPALKEFFEGEYYKAGYLTSIWFLREDPEVVKMALHYMHRDQISVRNYMARYDDDRKFELEIRLYMFALGLRLEDLQMAAFICLMERDERDENNEGLSPTMILDAAQVIYKEDQSGDDTIYAWFKSHLERKLSVLRTMDEWYQLLQHCLNLGAEVAKILTRTVVERDVRHADHVTRLKKHYEDEIEVVNRRNTVLRKHTEEMLDLVEKTARELARAKAGNVLVHARTRPVSGGPGLVFTSPTVRARAISDAILNSPIEAEFTRPGSPPPFDDELLIPSFKSLQHVPENSDDGLVPRHWVQVEGEETNEDSYPPSLGRRNTTTLHHRSPSTARPGMMTRIKTMTPPVASIKQRFAAFKAAGALRDANSGKRGRSATPVPGALQPTNEVALGVARLTGGPLSSNAVVMEALMDGPPAGHPLSSKAALSSIPVALAAGMDKPPQRSRSMSPAVMGKENSEGTQYAASRPAFNSNNTFESLLGPPPSDYSGSPTPKKEDYLARPSKDALCDPPDTLDRPISKNTALGSHTVSARPTLASKPQEQKNSTEPTPTSSTASTPSKKSKAARLLGVEDEELPENTGLAKLSRAHSSEELDESLQGLQESLGELISVGGYPVRGSSLLRRHTFDLSTILSPGHREIIISQTEFDEEGGEEEDFDEEDREEKDLDDEHREEEDFDDEDGEEGDFNDEDEEEFELGIAQYHRIEGRWF